MATRIKTTARIKLTYLPTGAEFLSTETRYINDEYKDYCSTIEDSLTLLILPTESGELIFQEGVLSNSVIEIIITDISTS